MYVRKYQIPSNAVPPVDKLDKHIDPVSQAHRDWSSGQPKRFQLRKRSLFTTTDCKWLVLFFPYDENEAFNCGFHVKSVQGEPPCRPDRRAKIRDVQVARLPCWSIFE